MIQLRRKARWTVVAYRVKKRGQLANATGNTMRDFVVYMHKEGIAYRQQLDTLRRLNICAKGPLATIVHALTTDHPVGSSAQQMQCAMV